VSDDLGGNGGSRWRMTAGNDVVDDVGDVDDGDDGGDDGGDDAGDDAGEGDGGDAGREGGGGSWQRTQRRRLGFTHLREWDK
jgi:hypothetical protein